MHGYLKGNLNSYFINKFANILKFNMLQNIVEMKAHYIIYWMELLNNKLIVKHNVKHRFNYMVLCDNVFKYIW